jgi:hypothetical protein
METDVFVLLSTSTCAGFIGAGEAGMLTGKSEYKEIICIT